MRIILAESGHEFELNHSFSKSKSVQDLSQLSKEIEDKVQISTLDQILLAVNGTQIKDSSLDEEQDVSTIVLFNRRLLQDPSLVKFPVDTELVTNDMTMIPTIQELEIMIYACETQQHDKQEEMRAMLKDISQTIMETCQRRKTCIDTLAREISGQAIALEAALSNLESHVKTAYQNFGKFDRIAQREFAKHRLVINQIASDLQLLVSTTIHPRILAQIRDAPHSPGGTTTLAMDLMEQHQEQYTLLQKQYQALTQATLEQRNKVDYLTQQTSQVGSTNRTASELMVAKVERVASEAAQAMRHLQATCQKKMGSRRLRDAFRSMYRYQHMLSDADRTVQQQRRLALQAFVNCMQHISKVEVSVAHMYPTLAELEKQMKGLRVNIEKRTTDDLPKKLILGYGLLLIEIWRRDRYSDIVTKHARLSSHFGQREARYRQHFNQQLQYITRQHKQTSEQQAILLPFEMQDINDSPVMCKTSSSTAVLFPSDAPASSFITKHQIESFIQSIHYYQDVTVQLHRKFDRESKRLNKGLSLLGGADGRTHQTIPLSLSTPSTTDMKLATPTTITGSFFQHHQNDWEFEKVSFLRQLQEYRNYIDETRTTYQNDRIKFEKDKQNLLKELVSKDKKIEEIKTLYELKINHEERKRQEAENTLKKQMEHLQNQHNHALQTEQITYKRRLSNFYRRINDKDQAITQLEQSLRETKSAPTSPTFSSFQMTVSQEKYDQDIARLQQIIDQLKKQPPSVHAHATTTTTTTSQAAEAHNGEMEKAYKVTIADLQVSLQNANAKVAQMTKSEARLKQLALAENTHMMMQAEARVENLATEHKQTLLEWEEAFENEKCVLQIKHQTELDQVKQDMTEALNEWEEAFENEKRVLQIKHQTELDQIKQDAVEQQRMLQEQRQDQHDLKLDALESSWQEKLKLIQQQYEQSKREARSAQRDLINLQREHKSAKNMAKDLVSVSSPQQHHQTHDLPLLDMLQRTLGNITSLQTKNSMLEQSMDSPYTMSTSYGYY